MKSEANMIRAAVIAMTLIVWMSGSSGVASDKKSAIDSLMHNLSQRGQFNGSVLVAERGSVIYANGFGKADAERDVKFSASTPCYLASLTKQFTAMAVMILVERRKLSYNDSLSKFFTQFPAFARKVTIRHLLNHTSGIPDYVGLGIQHPGLTNREVLDALVRQDSFRFAPGEKFEYSNSGYILLSLIIEKVAGEPFGKFLKTQIFGPLGMNSTFVYDESHPDIPSKARGYNRFDDLDDYDLNTVGEGGVYSSVLDLFAWDKALYTEKTVKQSTLAEAFQGAKLNDGSVSSYGFGWALGDYDGETISSHAGRYGGFDTYIKRFPRERNTVIFLTNHDFKNMRAIGNSLIGILYDKPFTLPKLSVAESMFRVYRSNGVKAALEFFTSLKNGNDTTYDFSESELNELGYELLGIKKFPDAIEVLKLNAQQFPASANAYDGLGEAYMDNGDKELAVRNYQKELELNPGNQNALLMLKKLGEN